MRLHVIETGTFKLDGGAMFGVVPKAIWQKTNPADENNLCTWSMRCLLVEDGDRLMLIDTGIGQKQDDRFLRHYHLSGGKDLKASLADAGFQPSDVTDVFLTHLHFDHCGGAVERSENGFRTTFTRARYWTNRDHWDWAVHPNAREKASFLTENIMPLEQSGQLHLTHPGAASQFPDMDVIYVSGHTEKMMIPIIRYGRHQVAFMADLLPSIGHIPLPYVMGYDTRPLLTLEEKGVFLERAARDGIVLFFEHDPVNECCTVQMTDKGVRLKEAFPLSDLG